MDPKEKFYRQFQVSAGILQEQIDRLPEVAAIPGERQDAVGHILSGISRLSNQVADAADYVPAYDQRTYSAAVKALTDQVNEATAKITPKSRFQFKQRPGNSAAPAKPDTRRLNLTPNSNNSTASAAAAAAAASSSKPADAKDTVGALPTFTHTASTASASTSKNYNAEIARPAGGMGIRKPSFSTARDIHLSDHSRVHITLPASAARATSAGTLTNLDRCVVDMSVPTRTGADAGAAGAPFASLALKDIAGSAIVAGHVDGPVHVTGLRDCVVMVVARQVRIHECRNVVFYLHCVSRPIIEDCKGVRFAKVPESYLTDKEKAETNLYDQVDDFKWIKATSSPNWSVLPDEEAIPDATWKKALAGGPGVIVDDTLRSLGVGKAN
ncbi:hypothetical protein NEMBOFW57_003818 [Staphylotrichum longicolle]|uniref:C-CAP/cofactor C-like domain-containing protein n=1 Tax=Staphylotrichum longicolle TaxID=669026 RepID=A0AAD4I3N1_9PEZI|nr:hypothetical protein NEMBOFW57_003818 [Staphylotrichum longicolle]